MKLLSGYGIEYDPIKAIEKLDINYKQAINELWENLYHQGDVGTASYYAVPHLIERGELYFVGVIELARRQSHNPKLPTEIENDYFTSLDKAINQNPKNEIEWQGYYLIHALMNGQERLATALSLMSIDEIIEEYK